MKFICSRAKLMDVVNTVQRAISAKSVMPILECIKIESLDSEHILMAGTNVDINIEYNLECNVIEGGSVALASKIFGEIIRKMPEGDVLVDVNETNNITKISCGSSEFNIQGQDVTGFPQTPEIEKKFTFTIDEQTLKRLIRKSLPFIAVSEGKRPVLTGALFDIKNNCLNVVTTDSHRIAVIKEELKEDVEDTKIVVPGQTLRELLKILRDNEESNLKIIAGDRKLLFDFGSFKLFTRLLDGEFLRYEAIIAAVNPITMNINKRIFVESLERAILLINDDMSSSTDSKVPVRLSMGYDKLELSCITGKGQVHDSLKAEIEGGELEIGFNCRFLLDAMSVCDEELIRMEFSAPTSGCFIRSASGDDSYVYMVLPVRLYN